jgi:hypothetical protein
MNLNLKEKMVFIVTLIFVYIFILPSVIIGQSLKAQTVNNPVLNAKLLNTLPLKTKIISSLQSFNLQNQYMSHEYETGIVYPVDTQPGKELSTFYINQGLVTPEAGFISFESAAWPGHFFRHENNQIKLQKKKDNEQFYLDATFKVVDGLAKQNDNWVTFESINYPGYFIRHKDNQLYIEPNDGSELFKSDATFRFVQPFWNGENKTVRKKGLGNKPVEDRELTTIISMFLVGVIYVSLNVAAKFKQRKAVLSTFFNSDDPIHKNISLTPATNTNQPYGDKAQGTTDKLEAND